MSIDTPAFPKAAAEESSVTEVLDRVLEGHRPRYLFYCLLLYPNPVRLPMIADQVTVWERARSDTSLSFDRHRLRVYNALYHDYLPALREVELVTYQQTGDSAALGSAATGHTERLRERLARELPGLLEAEADAIEASRRDY
ncbi:DUF7344 domain-containing protein [Haloarcula salina]|uniref:DUF7344 domain-containing protein n=1 Tax=Haloarcula salina TaxID=1429914 RepID=UPI003C6EB8A0